MSKTFLLTLCLGTVIMMVNSRTQAVHAPSCSGCLGGYGYFSSYSSTVPTFFSSAALSECTYDLSQNNCTKGTNPGPQMCVCTLLYTKDSLNFYTSCLACQAASGAVKSHPKEHGRK